ncbi:unnamed protein product [Rotaria sp. Silwood2]|nr:unnamed protein product [Rotaria sp. Silwood2]CAF2854573.1 unnamed protein product [Rotaria sp. Silwood2]CAF3904105.1 unnamed protein product [Rotaria sp. Silwood2]CAF3930311.1 unnamed protein product [Rotaria sp. Silwood2]
MDSTSDSLQTLPPSDPLITSKNNHIKRTNTLLSKPLHTEQDVQQLNKFISNSQSNFPSDDFLSKTQFDITPEIISQLNQNQSNIPRRPRVKWVATRHTSLHNSLNFQTTSLNDFQTRSMTDTNIKQDIQINPAVSIPDITTKEFDDEYQNYIEKIYQDDLDQTLKYTNTYVLTSEDEEEEINNIMSEDNDLEPLDIIKGYVDQGSQAVLVETKSKKKPKSPRRRKTKSSPRRAKQTNALPNSPSMLLSSSTNQVTPNSDLTALTTPIKVSASITKTEENNGIKSLITVDTSKARSNLPVVRLCLRELGWKECVHGTTLDSDIYWHSSSFHEGNTNFTFSSGRINKFPGMGDLLRKVHLTRLLNNMRLLFPNDYDFYPKTWFLPEQSQQFKDDVRYLHQLDKKHNHSLTTFIVKPSDGSQGEGIYLLRDPSHIITTNRPHVIQEYIDKPLLMNGLKFDLRIYVLILNLYPLEIYLYDEGLARFATVDYKAPSTENLHETFMHLTNYSLNKRSSSYKHPVDDKQTDGSKRKLSLVWKQLCEMFGKEKIERTKSLIVEMINKTILAILPELRVAYEFELPLGKKQNLSCFQIIGFDIILNDHLKPILLEVNSNPSLRIDFDKNEAGKIIYQPSPIDEEIKKPLVLETLKMALPKKKLDTITRHAQIQVNDEIMAQRVEKVAQRRLVERSEKIKSARKTRFDMKLNPFFSRPLESIAKEFVRQQHGHQQFEQQKLNNSSPTHPIILSQSSEDLTAYTFINHNNNHHHHDHDHHHHHQEPIKSYRKIINKSKQYRYSTDDDDDESGSPPATTVSEGHSSTNTKQPSIKSPLNRSGTTIDAAMIKSINTLKLIFPTDHHRTKYRQLFLVDNIAYIYIHLVVMLGYKTMTGGQFRSFANICGIINETITAPSIDILYYQILRKWQQFVVRTTLTGLPFAAFIEAFFLLSQRKFPNAQDLFDSVNQLLNICIRHLNSALQRPTSPLIHQSNQYLLHRSARNHNTPNSSSLNMRPNVGLVRSPTTTSMHRPVIVPTSAPVPRNHNHQNNSSTKPIDDKIKQKMMKQSTKSVFPLFFDVL